jgi:DNA (cytosine-5)-methyltransferase 1
MKVLKAADLFCGAGGASTGLVRACRELGLGLELLAINHWPVAVDTHSTNHPGVKHLCESVERVDPLEAVPGGRLHLLLAGPECTHFSTARGGRPVNPQSRASAWHILKWAQELYIDTILIENVPEFRTWGPIGANGKPLKSRKGETYRAFLVALRSLGYKVEDKILNAADYGDPTTRQRLFIMARRGRHQIAWPMPTHSKTGAATLFGKTKRWKAAREVIDWQVQGKSIFNRKKPLKPATIARILAGLEKFGGPELQPFLVILRRNQAGMSVDGPVPTITTSGAHVGLAQPFLMHITHAGSDDRTRSLDAPLPTITTAKRGEIGLIEPFVISAGGAKLRVPRGTSEPLPTVMGSDRLAIVEPYVLQQQSGGVPRSTDEPLPTIAAKGAIALAQPFILPPLRFDPTRSASVDEPLPTITATGGRLFGLAEPFLVPMYGECAGQDPRTHGVDEPVPTIPATGGGKFGVVEPFIVDAAFGRGDDTRRTRSVDEPVGTIPGSNRFALAEPFLTKYNRTAVGAYSVDEPIDTISTRDRFGLVQPVINGYVLDIHFRMLQPHELAAAMSFPKSYAFKGTREDVVKQIGNSWAGELSMALCVSAVQDFAPARRRPEWRAEATA